MTENANKKMAAKTTTIAFRVTEEELKMLHALELALGKSQSETLRFILMHWGKEYGREIIEEMINIKKAQRDEFVKKIAEWEADLNKRLGDFDKAILEAKEGS